MAALDNQAQPDQDVRLRATVSGAGSFRKTGHTPRPRSLTDASMEKPPQNASSTISDIYARLPPVDPNALLPVIAEAPTSLTVQVDGRTERVFPHTWIVLDSFSTVSAALNCLHADAGGGTVTEGGERLQPVPDDRLHSMSAEANFQRCSRATSVTSLRHAALILTLLGFRERQSGTVVPMGPERSNECSPANVVARARRAESIVAFRALAATQRPKLASTPRTLPPLSARAPSPEKDRGRSRQSVMQKGLQALEEFTRFAEHKFGNTVRAWFMLDPEGKMSIGQKQFARSCDEIGFKGNVVSLWRYLDSDQSGHITILELDSAAAVSLAELKVVIKSRFNNQSRAMFQFMDENSSDRLFKHEFIGSMKELGFDKAKSTRLFGMFDRDRLGSITSKDVEFLDRWHPPPYLFAKPDSVGLENFKNVLRSMYTSLLRAWRQLIDKDCTMRVSWDEFSETCAYLQKKTASGAMTAEQREYLPRTEDQRAGIWRALDEDCGGWIALAEFDQDSYDCLATFKRYCIDEHGCVATGFQAISKSNNSRVSEVELEVVEDLDAKLLIQGLNVNHNVVVHHIFDDKTGKKHPVEVPFLVEKDVRFLDKWDLEWEEEEQRAKHQESSKKDGHEQLSPRAGG